MTLMMIASSALVFNLPLSRLTSSDPKPKAMDTSNVKPAMWTAASLLSQDFTLMAEDGVDATIPCTR